MKYEDIMIVVLYIRSRYYKFTTVSEAKEFLQLCLAAYPSSKDRIAEARCWWEVMVNQEQRNILEAAYIGRLELVA